MERTDVSPFQSTLPVGGATRVVVVNRHILRISIHAPRGGSDLPVRLLCCLHLYFNPRSPWGERPPLYAGCSGEISFQSTLPVGGATRQECQNTNAEISSIHAPRGGSDSRRLRPLAVTENFNPRSPWGERHNRYVVLIKIDHFNPRSPWGERR